jgi:hypothetical protein
MGNCRIWDGDGDGVAVVDMGAYEYGAIPVGIDNTMFGGRRLAVGGFPNPFSDYITIEYDIEESGIVSLTIFDNIGQEVVTLVNEPQLKGIHQIMWNTKGMPAGIYFINLCSPKGIETKKIIKY